MSHEQHHAEDVRPIDFEIGGDDDMPGISQELTTDDIDDVVSCADLLKGALRNKCHGAMDRQEHPNESAADQSHKPGDKFATRLHRVET